MNIQKKPTVVFLYTNNKLLSEKENKETVSLIIAPKSIKYQE